MNVQIKCSSEYTRRWGRVTKRQTLGHPKRQERRERAAVRQADEAKRSVKYPRRKSVRLGRTKMAAQ